MGYTTEFEGRFSISKPVEKELADYINRFSSVRHMKRDVNKLKEIYLNWKDLCYKGNLGTEGEYFAVNSTCFGQEKTADIIEYNQEPSTQPGLWCQWIIPDNDLAAIEWDQGEKFYEYEAWLVYLINNFLAPNGYVVNGIVNFQGEDDDDMGHLYVKDNNVKIIYGETYL